MDERTINLSQADSNFEFPTLANRSVDNWASLCPERLAWSASYAENSRFKCSCFIQELATGKLIKKLNSPGGTSGPVVTDDYIVFGGGANGATPGVFARDTLKKVGGLKGHKSHLSGLIQFGNNCITIGGKNSRPFDDTVRIWDVATQSETLKVKLTGRPQFVAAHGDRIYVQTWAYPSDVGLFALDTNGLILWGHETNAGATARLSMTSDGKLLALIDGEKLTFLNPDGDVQKSCSLEGTGNYRLASCWGAPEFSPDDRYLFLTPEYDDVAHGTIVIDVERCEPVLQLHGVVRPRPFGDNYGAFLGTKGPVTHFGVVPKALIEP